MSANIYTKGLGLRADFRQPEDANYPVRFARHEEPVRLETKGWAFFDRIIDQGDTGTCVGHAGKYWLGAGPVINVDMHEEPSAFTLYRECCPIDEWPENDNGDLDFGTSLNALMKVLRARGHVTRWEHTEDADDVIKFLAGVNAEGKHIGGPVLLAVPWYRGMYDTDAEGFLHPTGRFEGYHALAGFRYNVERDFVYGPNSWGYSFGPFDPEKGRQTGYWRMSGDTLRFLLQNGGEAVVGREIR